MRTCSKTQKYWIAHNFFNFDRNIGVLHLILIVLMKEIPVRKNFFKFELPSSHNYSKRWKTTHFWFQFFSHPFYMGILCMERHVQIRWMYLNRSHTKLEWEHAVKLRNIGLLITSLILIITLACCMLCLTNHHLTCKTVFLHNSPLSYSLNYWTNWDGTSGKLRQCSQVTHLATKGTK